MIKVRNELTVYEVDGREVLGTNETVVVLAHWNRSAFVVLEVSGKKVTVAASDLEAALRNATNTGRH